MIDMEKWTIRKSSIYTIMLFYRIISFLKLISLINIDKLFQWLTSFTKLIPSKIHQIYFRMKTLFYHTHKFFTS